MKLPIAVVLLIEKLILAQLFSGDGAPQIIEETSGSIFEDSSLWVSESRGGGESRDGEEILVEFVTREPHSSNQSITNNTPEYNPTYIIEQTTERFQEESNMLVVGLAVGLGVLFIIIAIIVAACCVLRKRKEAAERNVSTQKRPVEKNPVEQTFERVDFNRQTRPDRLRNQKATLGSSGDQTISELAPSSMGTMRTFVQISNQAKPVSHVAIDSDFRNTSSDVDSIESSNGTSATGGANIQANQIVAKKKMAQVIEKSAIVTSKVNTYGYQELPTRDQSSHASYSTSSSSQIGHQKAAESKDQSYLPPFETITRSKDSVIDL